MLKLPTSAGVWMLKTNGLMAISWVSDAVFPPRVTVAVSTIVASDDLGGNVMSTEDVEVGPAFDRVGKVPELPAFHATEYV